MAASYRTATGNGATVQYALTFSFISRDHVHAYLDGVENTDWSWVNDALIEFDVAPGNGVAIKIARETPTTPIVDFSDGSTLTEDDQDTSLLQSLYVAEESNDRANDALNLNTAGTMWDAESKKIDNVAEPTASDHAATKNYVDTTTTASVAAAAASAAAALVSEGNAATSEANAASSASAADTAKTNAETAETNAETAETNAEAAQAAAEAASTAAQTAADTAGFRFTFDSSTTMADPGTGDIRLNHATAASVTQIALSALSVVSGNPDISDFVVTWDDSTNTVRGTLILRDAGTPGTFAVFSITGAITDNGAWLQIPVTHVVSTGALGGDLYLQFSRAGNAGSGTGDLLAANNLSDLANAGTARTNLGLGALATLAAVGTAQITDANVTKAKIENVSADKLLGRGNGGGAGAPQEITLGTGLSMSGTTLNASGGTDATQAEMEAASSTSVSSTPGRQHFHPGHPKFWGYVTYSGGTPTLGTSYNMTSITDTNTGRLGITIANDFSSAVWAPWITNVGTESDKLMVSITSLAAGTAEMRFFGSGGGLADPGNGNGGSFGGFGDL